MTISVIIPVYNRAHLIGTTLDSLLRQSLPADEIIVVDDGSTDGTVDIVRGYGGKVSLVCQPDNGGPGAARNAGLARATGSHVMFFDSDDLATPDYLKARATVAKETGAQIVYGAWAPVSLENGVCRHDGFARQSRAVRGNALSAFLRSWVLLLQDCLIDISLVREVGGYPEDLVTGEDMLLLFRMLKAGARLGYAAGPLLLLRQHPEGQISASTGLAAQRKREELIMTGRVLEELGDFGNHATAAQAWRARHFRSLAEGVANDPTVAAEFGTLSIRERFIGSVWGLMERLERGVSARTLGHRVPRIFETAPISETHLAGIRSLGYEPSRF